MIDRFAADVPANGQPAARGDTLANPMAHCTGREIFGEASSLLASADPINPNLDRCFDHVA
jgi:hypothetical protein